MKLTWKLLKLLNGQIRVGSVPKLIIPVSISGFDNALTCCGLLLCITSLTIRLHTTAKAPVPPPSPSSKEQHPTFLSSTNKKSAFPEGPGNLPAPPWL